MSAFADLTTRIPDELADEFLKRLPYVSEGIANFRLLPGAARVAFDLRGGFENQSELVATRISEVASKLCSNYRPGITKTLIKREGSRSGFVLDPHPLLQERGELIAFGRGRYGLGPSLTALVEYFDWRVRRMGAEFHAESRTFPSLIGADVLDRCRYIRNFPASLNLVSHLREDHSVIQEFARSANWNGAELACEPASLSGIECLLSPSVCFHWYMWLRDSNLPEPVAITALGKCFRYESSNLKGLERLWDFTMREIIFVGPTPYVLSARDQLVDRCAEFLDELGLAYEISGATDPFFVDGYAVQAAYQQGFELKFEIKVPLPYSGQKLAVGSINYHQDFFGRSFGIQSDGGAAHTGCLGFGFERLALAFLSQHGVDPQGWPKAARSAVERTGTNGHVRPL